MVVRFEKSRSEAQLMDGEHDSFQQPLSRAEKEQVMTDTAIELFKV
jgi:hypothetical protein